MYTIYNSKLVYIFIFSFFYLLFSENITLTVTLSILIFDVAEIFGNMVFLSVFFNIIHNNFFAVR